MVESPTSSPASSDDRPPPRWYVALTCVVLGLIGAAYGVLGAFHSVLRPVPVALIVAPVANYAFCRVGRREAGTAGALAPAASWLVVVLYLSMGRAEGDVVITNSWRGLGFLLLGTVGAAMGIARRPRVRPPVQAAPTLADKPSDSTQGGDQ